MKTQSGITVMPVVLFYMYLFIWFYICTGCIYTVCVYTGCIYTGRVYTGCIYTECIYTGCVYKGCIYNERVPIKRNQKIRHLEIFKQAYRKLPHLPHYNRYFQSLPSRSVVVQRLLSCFTSFGYQVRGDSVTNNISPPPHSPPAKMGSYVGQFVCFF